MESGVEITTNRQNEVWSIGVTGDLTRNSESLFFAAYPWMHGQNDIKYIVFDMSKLTYVNSAGIALLIRFVREAQQRNYSTFAFGVSPHYQKIFRIVGLTSFLELFPDEYSAMETLRTRSTYES